MRVYLKVCILTIYTTSKIGLYPRSCLYHTLWICNEAVLPDVPGLTEDIQIIRHSKFVASLMSRCCSSQRRAPIYFIARSLWVVMLSNLLSSLSVALEKTLINIFLNVPTLCYWQESYSFTNLPSFCGNSFSVWQMKQRGGGGAPHFSPCVLFAIKWVSVKCKTDI